MQGAKGDIQRDTFLLEAKATEMESFRLELTTLCKIKFEAMSGAKTPALTVNFVNGNGHPKPNGSWVCIQESDFIEYMQLKSGIAV